MEWCAFTYRSSTLMTLPLLTLCILLGDSTFAAITAVVAANVVLVAYIVSSLREDRAEQEARKLPESRKDR